MKMQFIVLAGMLVFKSAWAAEADFEIKGIRLGVSELDLTKLYPQAKCGSSERQADWGSSIARQRVCTVPKFTLAGKATVEAKFSYLEGRLEVMEFGLQEQDYSDVVSALSEKFGAPVPLKLGGGASAVNWTRTPNRMWAYRANGKAGIEVQSPAIVEWRNKVSEFDKKKRKADL